MAIPTEPIGSIPGPLKLPGGDCGSTHSADVDYAGLLPSLFELQVGNFYIAPIDPRIETPEEVE
jgi:5-methyltetrahydropteroyltriglutamate--homocysteine methyltransferase